MACEGRREVEGDAEGAFGWAGEASEGRGETGTELRSGGILIEYDQLLDLCRAGSGCTDALRGRRGSEIGVGVCWEHCLKACQKQELELSTFDLQYRYTSLMNTGDDMTSTQRIKAKKMKREQEE